MGIHNATWTSNDEKRNIDERTSFVVETAIVNRIVALGEYSQAWSIDNLFKKRKIRKIKEYVPDIKNIIT